MTAPSAAGSAAPVRPATTSVAYARRIVVSSSIDNAFEQYDFLVYGLFASVTGKLFFPADDKWVSLLFVVGSFGVSFITRPVGAIVLGMYADKKGRKAALTLSILLVIIGMLATAVMPSYQQIGTVAPVTILLARLVQGFAMDGEFGSATVFMIEHSTRGCGYYASWQFASQSIATILAAGLSALLTASLSPADLEGWGWHLPFIFGLLVGLVGFYIRCHLDETPEFAAEQRKTTIDPQVSLKAQWTSLLLAVGVVTQSTASVYALQLYMLTYAVKQLYLSAAQSFVVVMLNGGPQFLLSPVMSALSDRVGRIRIMLTTSTLMILLIYPMFALLCAYPTIGALLTLQAVSGIFKAAYSGPIPALMSEIFPTCVRSTGLSLGYSLGVTLFGGFAPFIVTWLIHTTGDTLAPSYYVLTAAAMSVILLTIIALRRRRQVHAGRAFTFSLRSVTPLFHAFYERIDTVSSCSATR